ncbi:MAG: DUF2207 family protein [Aristaeellaceae bacterium]
MGRSFRRVSCFVLLTLLLSVLPLIALAADYSAELSAVNFDIALQEDGSALITETREIVFTGDHEFTRYGVNNTFTGPRVFTDWQVTLDGMPLPHLPEPDNDNRPTNTFAVEDKDGGTTVYIYFRQQGDGKRVFRISYRLENAVKLYDDVGEFSWNLTGETAISGIGMLTATVTAPEGVPTEDFLIWAHGPQNGSFDKQSDGSALLQAENVTQGTIVDIRVTLPADCLYGGWVQEGSALETILAEEQELADRANAKREEEAREQEERARIRAENEAYWAAYWADRNAWAEAHPMQNSIMLFCMSIEEFIDLEIGDDLPNMLLLLGIGLFILGVFWGKIRRNRSKSRHTPEQSPQYCQTLPDDRPAPVVDRLLHFYEGQADVSRQITSTLLELSMQGLLKFRTVDDDVELVLNTRQGEKLFPASDADHKPDYQEALWNFLVNAAEGNGQITMSALKQYIRDNQSTAASFRADYFRAVAAEYDKTVHTQVIRRPLFGGSKIPLILSLIAGILVTLIHLGSLLYSGIEVEASLIYGVITFVMTWLMFFVFSLGRKMGHGRIDILDQASENDLALWQAFGRYLDDFTNVADKALPDIAVWQEYMVYAVAMGYGSRVADTLRVKYPEASAVDSFSRDDELYRMMQEMEMYRLMESIGQDVSEARYPVSSSSSSSSDSGSDSWSDSSGGGGGFSDSGGGSDSGSSGDFID